MAKLERDYSECRHKYEDLTGPDYWGLELYYIVMLLKEYNSRGIFAKFNFNGVMLYSDTVDMDAAYLEITGHTKAQMDELYKQKGVNRNV